MALTLQLNDEGFLDSLNKTVVGLHIPEAKLEH
jgi:hypothetical protein